MSATPEQMAAIRQAMPTLSIDQVRTNHDGLINDIVIVNDELVFRFPKDDYSWQALRRELKVLQLVQQYVTLPAPIIEQETDTFVLYRLLPGRGLQQSDILRADQRTQDALAEQVATSLAQLHTIPRSAIDALGIGNSDAVRTRADWLKFYARVQDELFPLLMSNAKVWVNELFAPVVDGSLDLAPPAVLVHGDLGPYHLLYDEHTQRLCGILDFGTSGLGDPADDFACVINGLGESFLRRMSHTYPAIRDALDRSRFWAGTLELQWLIGGLNSTDRSWFAVHIGRARDVLPIGVVWAE